MKRHYSALLWRNTTRLARLLSLLDKHAMFVQSIFVHLGHRLAETGAGVYACRLTFKRDDAYGDRHDRG